MIYKTSGRLALGNFILNAMDFGGLGGMANYKLTDYEIKCREAEKGAVL